MRVTCYVWRKKNGSKLRDPIKVDGYIDKSNNSRKVSLCTGGSVFELFDAHIDTIGKDGFMLVGYEEVTPSKHIRQEWWVVPNIDERKEHAQE